MDKTTIAGLLPLLFVAGCVSTSEEPMNKGISCVRGTQYIRFEDIQACPDVLDELFSLHASETLTIGNKDIHIGLYKKKESTRESGLVYCEEAPGIVVASSGDKRVILKMDTYMLTENIRYKIPKISPPVLCICNPNDGNCSNCTPWYVLSLEKESFLENLGEVSWVRDYNKDGIDDMVWFEDIWENGLGWFCHADAPGAIIFYHIEKSKLVPDAARNAQHWKNEIRQFNAQINALSRKTSKYSEAEIVELRHHRFFWPHLHVILKKFLRYRLLGESEKGWEELRNDLRHHDDQYFFFTFSGAGSGNGKVKTGKFPIQNIENTVRESLEHFRRLKEAP